MQSGCYDARTRTTRLAMISLEHRFLFIHVPKTAGNALQNVPKDYSEDTITATGELPRATMRFRLLDETMCVDAGLPDSRANP